MRSVIRGVDAVAAIEGFGPQALEQMVVTTVTQNSLGHVVLRTVSRCRSTGVLRSSRVGTVCSDQGDALTDQYSGIECGAGINLHSLVGDAILDHIARVFPHQSSTQQQGVTHIPMDGQRHRGAGGHAVQGRSIDAQPLRAMTAQVQHLDVGHRAAVGQCAHLIPEDQGVSACPAIDGV